MAVRKKKAKLYVNIQENKAFNYANSKYYTQAYP